jgi:nucleotide sugar dehydrogenase
VPRSDIVIVCVPTPLKKDRDPDLSFLKSVAKSLAGQLNDYKMIIVESTSYPGTTEEVFRPLLERGGKTAGRDFALVYSPERIDYGNASFGVRSIPKVVGGIEKESTTLGAAFYTAILQAQVVAVSGPSVAEATKMLENVFRYVNIALVNELAVLHEKLGVDFIEAIDAAATKPFGFMAHYPGPGVGGHCIPKDPFYLVYKAKKAGFPLKMVSAAEVLNNGMPKHTVERLLKTFRKMRKNPRKVKVAVWGLAYKGGVKDTRRSPSVDLLKLFQRFGVKAVAYDPLVDTIKVGSVPYASAESILDSVKGADAVVIATNHAVFRQIDLSEVRAQMNPDPILFDTRNLRTRKESEEAGFTYLATGRP